ncbi:hypothetical protein GCM10023152_06920 [Agromyces bauzanensis]|uniref:Threonine/serine exporter-like N-terminal domain-containing protein n=2 Tax=Agromyces bauzanensis TaxID=1308924 RepID=A0A917URV6_9MICO|nr:hypothetical protein GCM10011372_18990 [Agromyces bauzanensis]
MAPPYGRALRVIGYALLSGALAVMPGTTWTGVAVAVVLGAMVGAALLVSERMPSRYGALITVGVALAVSLVVFLLLDAGFGPRILAALIAPLVVLLAAGILTAGALVGVPDFDFAEQPEALGPIAPWIAVAVFGVGIAVHQCAPRRSIPWILLVFYVAYGAQVIGDVFLGGVLSAFAGAVVVIPVTALVARQPSGPAALVSFVPAFWLHSDARCAPTANRWNRRGLRPRSPRRGRRQSPRARRRIG